MEHRKGHKANPKTRPESGFSLLETMFSTIILLIGVVPLLALFGVAVGQNKTQGDVAVRTIEYSQGKMEQLLSLDFNDGSTDTTVFPTNPVGGHGLGGTMPVSSTVGSTNTAAPVAGYVDYLDVNGHLLTGPTGSFYTRAWSISTDATGNIKTIQVVAVAQSAVAGTGPAPSMTLISAKAFGH